MATPAAGIAPGDLSGPWQSLCGVLRWQPLDEFSEGTMEEETGEVVFASWNFPQAFPRLFSYPLQRVEDRRPLCLGIRREHVQLGAMWDERSLKAQVDVLEPVGRELRVLVLLRDQPITLITDPSKEL